MVGKPEKLTAKEALLDFYSDRAVAHASFFLASLFGLFTVLAITQNAQVNKWLWLIPYFLLFSLGVYTYSNFCYYAVLADSIRRNIQNESTINETMKNIGKEIVKGNFYLKWFHILKKQSKNLFGAGRLLLMGTIYSFIVWVPWFLVLGYNLIFHGLAVVIIIIIIIYTWRGKRKMRAINTTLTLLILVLPSLAISTCVLAVLYLYRISLNASAIISALSALLSAVLVNLLVWERLRDSLSRRLEYLHGNFLIKLYNQFQRRFFYLIEYETVESIKLDLERHGNFMGISLFPENLLQQISSFLISYKKFKEGFSVINKIGKDSFSRLENEKSPPFDSDLWRRLCYDLVGIEYEGGILGSHKKLGNYNSYKEKVETVENEQAELIKKLTKLKHLLQPKVEEITKELEEFLKSNSLTTF